jgi:hypothetical protein
METAASSVRMAGHQNDGRLEIEKVSDTEPQSRFCGQYLVGWCAWAWESSGGGKKAKIKLGMGLGLGRGGIGAWACE